MKRSYKQFCGVAKALDIVGERWTLLIVRNLLLGPQRYSDLQRDLPGITTNVLAQRLQEMEARGLIEKSASAYRLTPSGAGLEPAIHALGSWGFGHMGAPARGDYRSFAFLAVALRRRYRRNTRLRAEIVADGAPYRLTLTKTGAEIARGDMPSPDVRLTGPGNSLARLFLSEEATRRVPSDVRAEGSARAVRALLHAFAASDEVIVKK